MLPRTGELIGEKYRVSRVVADGGMGVVYEGTHELLRKTVALKFARPDLARLPGLSDRFLREARLCARIENEHVVRVVDFGTFGDLPYMVMEFVPGAPLSGFMRHLAKWTPGAACALAAQIVDGLEAVHAQGIVHRDVKPDNVLLLETPRGPLIKLADFGIARTPVPEDTIRRLTRAGAILGTPAYMAPEQVRGASTVDARADLYSVAVILFEMLAGELPVESDDAEHISSRVVAAAFTPLAERAPGLPQEVVALVARAMAPSPSDRFQNAGEMRSELERFAAPDELRGSWTKYSATLVDRPGTRESGQAQLPRTVAATVPATQDMGPTAGTDARQNGAIGGRGSERTEVMGPVDPTPVPRIPAIAKRWGGNASLLKLLAVLLPLTAAVVALTVLASKLRQGRNDPKDEALAIGLSPTENPATLASVPVRSQAAPTDRFGSAAPSVPSDAFRACNPTLNVGRLLMSLSVAADGSVRDSKVVRNDAAVSPETIACSLRTSRKLRFGPGTAEETVELPVFFAPRTAQSEAGKPKASE